MEKRSTSRITPLMIVAILILCKLSSPAQQLKDLPENIDTSTRSYSSLASLTPANGFFYFVLNDDRFGLELWKSDGTASGTCRVKDISPGPSSSMPENFLMANSVLYFTANDGVHGKELWRSDGTGPGTSLVKDIAPGENSSHPQGLTCTDDTVFFQTENETDGVQQWKSDGTPAGTVLVGDVFSGMGFFYPDYSTDLNGAFHEASHVIWKRDDASGEELLLTIDGSPMDLITVNTILFFTTDQFPYGRELWRSDGTTAGTVIVKDILAGPASSHVVSYSATMTELNGLLYFLAQDGVHGGELWRSDGTAEGTYQVKDILPGSGTSSIRDLTSVNGFLYFSAWDGVHGGEVWRSDGTPSGTTLLKDVLPGAESSNPRNFTAFNDIVYFSILGRDGVELWKTDGTTAGTLKVFPEAD